MERMVGEERRGREDARAMQAECEKQRLLDQRQHDRQLAILREKLALAESKIGRVVGGGGGGRGEFGK